MSFSMTPFTRQCAARIAPVSAAGTATASVTLTSGSLRVTRCEHSARSAANGDRRASRLGRRVQAGDRAGDGQSRREVGFSWGHDNGNGREGGNGNRGDGGNGNGGDRANGITTETTEERRLNGGQRFDGRREATRANGSDRENEHLWIRVVFVFTIRSVPRQSACCAGRPVEPALLRSTSVTPFLRVIPFAPSAPFRSLRQLARSGDDLRRCPAPRAQVAHAGVAVRLRQLLRRRIS